MADHPDINIICEKFTVESTVTRFEDTRRLPVGNCLNNNSFAAKAIVQVHIHTYIRMQTCGKYLEMYVECIWWLFSIGWLFSSGWLYSSRAPCSHQQHHGRYNIACTQAMIQPKLLLPLIEWGNQVKLMVRDSSVLARPDEVLTYEQLMVRLHGAGLCIQSTVLFAHD